MARLLLNYDEVLWLVCTFAIQSSSDLVHQARTCKALNNVLKTNITALCSGLNFNLDRIAAEYRQAKMYIHVTLNAPTRLEPFTNVKTIKFIDGHPDGDPRIPWSCGLPLVTTTVIVQGFMGTIQFPNDRVDLVVLNLFGVHACIDVCVAVLFFL